MVLGFLACESPSEPQVKTRELFNLKCFFLYFSECLGGVWFMFSNNNFQFLNNISRILTYFFTHTYFHKYF